MFALDMNKHLWKDKTLFTLFHQTVLKMNKTVADQNWNPNLFLDYANKLDEIMNAYEGRNGYLYDPIFFWSFATANAHFLLIGKKYDELGDTRESYVINGYREGLNKHIKYPSYPKMYIDKAFEHMSPFAEGEDAKWIKENRYKFIPVGEKVDEKFQAAFELLYIFALIDGEVSKSEFAVIDRFLKANAKKNNFSVENVIKSLQSMDLIGQLASIESAASLLFKKSELKELKSLLKIAVDITMADGMASDEQIKLLITVGNSWNFDSAALIKEYLNSK
ncbi:MAG: TerB family tellurite resistance protein [Desulfobacteraceae bacterium]|jgi:uncharacterized tellurite resistance protein B-like protein|nr:TerB family tellurite resistance protein [Desulfobacteraceae bacterium]